MADVLKEHGHEVKGSDIRDRGYEGTEVKDFFDYYGSWGGDIVTNPPYSMAKEFVEKALTLVPDGHKVCMFLKLSFLEGKGRKEFFRENPPLRVWVSSSRLICSKNGAEFNSATGNAVCYAWFVWSKGFKGATEVRWFN